MKRAFSLLWGLGMTTLGVAVGCDGSGYGPGPSGEVDRGAPCDGMCLGKLILPTDAVFSDMSIDRNRRRIYGRGLRVDVSNPRTMKTTPLPKIGPVVVDPNSGRYATTVSPGYGDDTQTLFVFESNDVLRDSKPLPGLAFAMDVDAANGRFFVTTRESDEVIVYDEGSRALLASRPLAASPLNPIFDAGSGRVFVNQYVASSSLYKWLILDQAFEAGPSSAGLILAADDARDLIYLGVQPVDGSVGSRLELRTGATWSLASTQLDTDAYWVAPDPVLDRLYVRRLNDVAVFDRTSGAYLSSLTFSDGFVLGEIAFVPGDDRIYVLGSEPLPSGSPAAFQNVLLVFAT